MLRPAVFALLLSTLCSFHQGDGQSTGLAAGGGGGRTPPAATGGGGRTPSAATGGGGRTPSAATGGGGRTPSAATGGGGRTPSAAASGGSKAERIQVTFTPTVCKVRCAQGRCVNLCDRGEATTVYSSDGARGAEDSAPFRVFVCPLLCQNGGVCLQKDRCLCPPSFTGKFCQIPVSSNASGSSPSSNHSPPYSLRPANQELMRSEFIMPLGPKQETQSAGAPSPPMVKVRVQHPPEASVTVHQVLKVAGLQHSGVTSGSAGFPAPVSRGIQAQTVTGGGTYSQHSGFKYCFREVSGGQCSSPLPGLRSRETCCRGSGRAWGLSDCELCPKHTDGVNDSCPVGFERVNGSKCEDVNECEERGRCENGLCVNTRGSYSCVCQEGFILDATHGLCISHRVISEEKGQCFRVVQPLSSPSSCALPILRSITKQICCCSRVGKAWGDDCQRCPAFGSVAFKEICPAGPGYHYSASALTFNQRVSEQLGHRGALLRSNSTDKHTAGFNSGFGVVPNKLSPPQFNPNPSPSTPKKHQSSAEPPQSGIRPVPPESQSSIRPVPPQSESGIKPVPPQSESNIRPVPPQSESGIRPVPPQPQSRTRPVPPQSESNMRPVPPQSESGIRPVPSQSESNIRPVPPQSHASSSSSSSLRLSTFRDKPQNPRQTQPEAVFDSVQFQPEQTIPHPQRPVTTTTRRPVTTTTTKRPITTSTRPPRVHSALGACQARPGVCGRGLCVNQPMGRHNCVCYHGYEANALNSSCHDTDECRWSPCGPHARCENSPGSFTCVCHHGYKLQGLTCTDVDECEDPLLCPGQECVNAPGSFSCVSCRPGFGLLLRHCTDIDECRQAPCTNGRCENTPGSYRCVCRNGYRLSNNTCSDIDECADPSQCPGQMCVNTGGSYRCVSCRHGYRLRNRQCIDIDECADPSQCPGQMCVNSVGSYRCVSCRHGYSARNSSCHDIDECLSPSSCSSNRVCVNTLGSFSCDCAPGYKPGRGRSCTDIDECLQSGVCSGGDCVNSLGSFSCVCAQGFSLSLNKTSCTASSASAPSSNHSSSTASSHSAKDSSHSAKDSSHSAKDSSHSAKDSSHSVKDSSPAGSFPSTDSSLIGSSSSVSRTSVLSSGSSHSSTDHPHSTTVPSSSSAGTSPSTTDPSSSPSSAGFFPSIDSSISGPSPSLSHTSGSSSSSSSGTSPSIDSSPSLLSLDTSRSGSSPSVSRTTSSSGSLLSASGSAPESARSVSRSALPSAGCGELCECYYDLESGVCSVLSANTTLQECCCTEGRGWGRGCVYHTCPPPHTEEFQSLCPNGRGYVTTGPGASDYTDVDECKRFGPEVCKSGVCVNNIPGFSCYCPSGYVFNRTTLMCEDHDECEEEESCSGGLCVNTQGSFYCSCPHPLVLDDTQRTCVNATQQTLDENVSLCWQHVTADYLCQSLLLGAYLSFTDCCCLYGDGWGLECALCPQPDTEGYARLCSSVHSPLYPEPFPDSRTPTGSRPGSRDGPGPVREGPPVPHFPPFSSEPFPPSLDYDDTREHYDESAPAGGIVGRYDDSAVGGAGGHYDDSAPAGGTGRFDPGYLSPPYGGEYFPESDYDPYSPDQPSFSPDESRFSPDGSSFNPDGSRFSADGSRFSPDRSRISLDSRPFLVPPDPRSVEAFEVQPLPASDQFYSVTGGEEEWRGVPPFARPRPGPRRVYDRRLEPVEEDCGIVDGCVNGRCIRVAEGYTCDCYHGYELDLTAMTCTDINECDGRVQLQFPCINARCVNTQGSYHCVCRRGYILSNRPNYCVSA